VGKLEGDSCLSQACLSFSSFLIYNIIIWTCRLVKSKQECHVLSETCRVIMKLIYFNSKELNFVENSAWDTSTIKSTQYKLSYCFKYQYLVSDVCMCVCVCACVRACVCLFAHLSVGQVCLKRCVISLSIFWHLHLHLNNMYTKKRTNTQSQNVFISFILLLLFY